MIAAVTNLHDGGDDGGSGGDGGGSGSDGEACGEIAAIEITNECGGGGGTVKCMSMHRYNLFTKTYMCVFTSFIPPFLPLFLPQDSPFLKILRSVLCPFLDSFPLFLPLFLP